MNKVILPFIMILFVSVASSYAVEETIPSPRTQLESGVTPEDILCKQDRFLVIRDNGKPACVTERTAEKMNLEILPRNLPVESNDSEDVFSEIPKTLTNFESNSLLSEISAPIYLLSVSEDRLVNSPISSPTGSSSSGSQATEWPKVTFDTPSEIQLGVPFDVNVTWTFVEFDHEEIGTIDDISDGDPIVPGVAFSIYTNDGVELITAPDFELTAERSSMYNYTTFEYKKVVDYDDTQVHEETYTFQINDPAPHPYNRISVWIEGHQYNRYFDYQNGIAIFSEDEIIPKSIEKFDNFSYEGISIIEIDENAEINPQFIDDLASFLRSSDPVNNMTEYLQEQGLSDTIIDALFASHPDLRH